MKKIFLLLVLLLPKHLLAEEVSVTGVYSNLAYHEDSGDLMGIEVHVLYSYSGYFAVVQCGGGDPAIVSAEVEAETIAFSLDEDGKDNCSLKKYEGHILEEGLNLKSGSENLLLPRQESYWINRDRVL